MEPHSLVPVSRQAFAVQYTSLILILLTFVIGAFSGSAQKPPQVTPEHEAIPVAAPETIGIYNLGDEEGIETISERLSPALEILANHDITATLSLSLGEHNTSQAWEQIGHIGEVLDLHHVAPDVLSIVLVEGAHREPFLRFKKPSRRKE